MKRYIVTALGVLLLVSTGYLLQEGESEATEAQLLASEEQTFAHVTPVTGIVDSVIVISQETITTAGGWYVGETFKPVAEWVQTSKKGTVRKNYAGKGYTYDEKRDAFIAPKPSPTAILNESKAQWEATTTCNATTTCP